MSLLKNVSPSMIERAEELQYGQPVEITGLDGLQVKVVITPKGITVISSALQDEPAQAMLQQLGFRPEQVGTLCIGSCCADQ